MKSFKLILASSFVLALLAPVFIVGRVSAQAQVETFLECFSQVEEPDSGACDLAIVKEVSVNGSAYVDANTEPDAVNATVGDTVTWKITVTDGFTGGDFGDPMGIAYIQDVLPTGFTLNNANPSAGTFSSNVWTLPLLVNGYNGATNLPAVLTLTTTATSSGVFENVAALSEYDECRDGCIGPITTYFDDFDTNNADNAWVSISGAPVVLADETEVLAATGSGLVASLLAVGLILSTAGVLAYNHISRRN